MGNHNDIIPEIKKANALSHHIFTVNCVFLLQIYESSSRDKTKYVL